MRRGPSALRRQRGALRSCARRTAAPARRTAVPQCRRRTAPCASWLAAGMPLARKTAAVKPKKARRRVGRRGRVGAALSAFFLAGERARAGVAACFLSSCSRCSAMTWRAPRAALVGPRRRRYRRWRHTCCGSGGGSSTGGSGGLSSSSGSASGSAAAVARCAVRSSSAPPSVAAAAAALSTAAHVTAAVVATAVDAAFARSIVATPRHPSSPLSAAAAALPRAAASAAAVSPPAYQRRARVLVAAGRAAAARVHARIARACAPLRAMSCTRASSTRACAVSCPFSRFSHVCFGVLSRCRLSMTSRWTAGRRQQRARCRARARAGNRSPPEPRVRDSAGRDTSPADLVPTIPQWMHAKRTLWDPRDRAAWICTLLHCLVYSLTKNGPNNTEASQVAGETVTDPMRVCAQRAPSPARCATTAGPAPHQREQRRRRRRQRRRGGGGFSQRQRAAENGDAPRRDAPTASRRATLFFGKRE